MAATAGQAHAHLVALPALKFLDLSQNRNIQEKFCQVLKMKRKVRPNWL